MGQVSYGTITITDTTDIENVFLIYKGSSSDTNPPSIVWSSGGTVNDWVTDISSATGDYIWAITVFKRTGISITQSNYTDFYSDPVCLTGEPGTSVTVTSITYSTVTTESKPQDSTFTLTDPPTVPEGGWLWSRVLFSDGKSIYSKAKQGQKGEQGERGTSILKITTAPTAYTTTIGGFTPSYRVSLSTVKTQSGKNEVLVGDVVEYDSNHYRVGYVDSSYVYLGPLTSIKGASGQSYYTYIRYADDSSGTNMSSSPTGKTYIGVYSGTSSTAPATPNSYTWSKYVGNNGSNGVSVTAVRELYYLTTGNAPSTPTEQTTIYDYDVVGAWTSVVPEYVVNGNYYISLETTLSNTNRIFSAATLDKALTDSNYNAYLAKSISQNANENAQGAMSQATAAQYQADALNAKLKYFFYPGDNNYPGVYAASGITGTTFNEGSISTYGYNVAIKPASISIGYNNIKAILIDGSNPSLKFYAPSKTTQGPLTMELASSGLTFYDGSSASGGNVQAQFGSSGAIQSGDFAINNATDKFSTYGTKIDLAHGEIYSPYFRLSQGSVSGGPVAGIYMSGTFESTGAIIGYQKTDNSDTDAFWRLGYLTDTNQDKLVYQRANGVGFIELGQSSTFILQKNKLHTGWFGNNGYLTYPYLNSKYYDFGMNLPTSLSDKFLYIKYNTGTNLSTIYQNDSGWNYLFYVDGNGKVHAQNFYIGDSDTPIGGGAGTIAEKLLNGAGSGTNPVYFRTDSGHVGELAASTSTVGGTTTPIYMNNGVLTALGYTIAKSVPSDAVFTDHITTATTSGSGNAVTSVTANGNGELTITKGATFLTSYTETDPTVPGWAKASSKPSYTASEVGAVATSAVGAASGVAPLNASSKIDSTYLPSYVDDVIEGYYYNNKFWTTSAHTTEISGEAGKIYVDLATNKTYRYGSSTFTEISQGSIVTISRSLTSGTKSATITVDGTSYDLYAPTNTNTTYSLSNALSSHKFTETLTAGGSGSGTSTATMEFVAGGAITLTDDTTNKKITIAHTDTSNQASSSNSGRTYIQSIGLDGYGHVTSLSTATETVTDTHYTTHLYVGLSNSTGNAATSTSQDTYLRLFDDTTARESHKLSGNNGLTISSDSSGHITFASPIAFTDASVVTVSNKNYIRFTKSDGNTKDLNIEDITIVQAQGATKLVNTDVSSTPLSVNGPVKFTNGVPETMRPTTSSGQFLKDDGTWATPYTLPLAANGTRGGVQIGYTQTGKNYPVQLSSEKMYVYVPWENTTYSAGTGLSLSGTTLNHSNSVTAGTAGTSSATSSTNRTIAIPYVTYDAQGHITASGTHTHTLDSFPEAYLAWGGKNFSASYGPIDAAMIDVLGANRFAFLKAVGLTIEYSTNGGSTWTDYGATDIQKIGLFAGGQGFYLGKHSAAGTSTLNDQLRVTISTGAAGIYTVLNKIAIYMSTSGNTVQVKMEKALESTPTTYTTHLDWTGISGWSGWNILNISGVTTYGNTAASQYGRLRFTFKQTAVNSGSYSAASISRIMGFGGVGWSVPSNMARDGHLYSYDASQNATFPAKVTATNGFSGALTGDVTGNVTGTATGNLTSVQYDTTNKKITYTKNGSNTDVVTASTLKTDMSLNNVENTKLSTWVGSSNITTVGTISSGTWSGTTIAVTKGGTGMTTATNVNAVVIGNSSTATNAMQTVRTGNGAFYATAQDAKPTFGTLPVGQGGTGLTSSPSMLTNLASTTAANVLVASPRPGVTGTLGVGNGGTGQTSAKNAANAFLNALDTGSSTPVDADYYISQYVGGGTTTTTYHRRPMSALWSYISGKISASGTYVQKSGDVMTGTLETPELIAIKIKADDVVTQLLTAEGIQTKNWTASNISTIDGSFYICPTISCISGTIKYVSSGGTLEMNAGDGYSFDINSIFTKNNNSAAWTSSSWVMVTGEVSINNEWVPIGTIRGKITATAPTTSKITIGNLTSNLTDGLSPKILELMTNNVAHTFRNLKISLYSYFNNSQENLLGIMLTTAGAGNRTYIDIYDGSNKTNGKTSSSGFVYTEPMVRIGNLNGLNSYTQSNKFTVTPSGWGIYTTNGFFVGDVYAENGYIGGFTIGTSDIHNGKTSKSETTNDGVWVGTDGIGFGKGVTYFSNDGTGKIGPWTLTKTALYNGSTGINNTTSGVYLGYTTNNTGLNISGGSAATTITIANSNFTKTINGTSYSTLRVAIGSNFGMDSSGNIYANGANITNINANNISTNMLSAMQAVVSSLSVLRADMGSITAGSISRGNNSINFNQDLATLEFKNASTWASATQGIKYDSSGLAVKGAITATSLTISSSVASNAGLATSSDISDMATNAKTDWTVVVTTTNTPDFVTPSVTLKAIVYHRGAITTSGFTRAWYKNGTGSSLGSGETITVTDMDAYYVCIISEA